MTGKSLRALAKEFANGALGREAYRKARRELIEGVLAGRIQVEAQEFRAPVEVDLDITAESDRTALRPERAPRPSAPPSPPPAAAPAYRRSHLAWIVGSAVVILLCLIILAVLIKGSDPFFSEPFSLEKGSDPLKGAEQIEEFLQENNWTDYRLDEFLAEWRALSPEEQAAARSAPAMTRLANAINQQLIEERALIGLGADEKARDRQTALVNFAEQVGINATPIK